MRYLCLALVLVLPLGCATTSETADSDAPETQDQAAAPTPAEEGWERITEYPGVTFDLPAGMEHPPSHFRGIFFNDRLSLSVDTNERAFSGASPGADEKKSEGRRVIKTCRNVPQAGELFTYVCSIVVLDATAENVVWSMTARALDESDAPVLQKIFDSIAVAE